MVNLNTQAKQINKDTENLGSNLQLKEIQQSHVRGQESVLFIENCLAENPFAQLLRRHMYT